MNNDIEENYEKKIKLMMKPGAIKTSSRETNFWCFDNLHFKSVCISSSAFGGRPWSSEKDNSFFIERRMCNRKLFTK